MKKPKARKIRKVWVIKPQPRVRTSRKREMRAKVDKREGRDPAQWA